MIVTYQNREVEIELGGACYDPDYWCDVFLENATWCDTGKELTDDELDKMNESGDMCDWIVDYLF